MKRRILGVLAPLIIAPLFVAQNNPVTVHLDVQRNGVADPLPDRIAFSFDGHYVDLPVRIGRFEAPLEVVNATQVEFWAVVGGDQIHVPGISGRRLRQDHWTLVLEDRRFNEEFRPVVPKKATARLSCILRFESANSQRTDLFNPRCRVKLGAID